MVSDVLLEDRVFLMDFFTKDSVLLLDVDFELFKMPGLLRFLKLEVFDGFFEKVEVLCISSFGPFFCLFDETHLLRVSPLEVFICFLVDSELLYVPLLEFFPYLIE